MKTIYKEIRTSFGSLFYHKAPQDNHFHICDSEKWYLFYGFTKTELKHFIKLVKGCKTIKEWLENYDDVCWGSKQDIIDYTKDYQICNGRNFDIDWLERNYNKVGDTYIMFEYSDCWE